MVYRTLLFSDRDFHASKPIEEEYHDTLESADAWLDTYLVPGYYAYLDAFDGEVWHDLGEYCP